MGRKLSRRTMLRTLGVGAGTSILAAGRPARGEQGKKKPNIIFIFADDLGYGDLGCYGQKTIQTPNIDAMASEGMLFTDCYAGSTVCAPSRCCLMTGRHTGHAIVRGNGGLPLPPDAVTVAEVLKKAGYTTGIIGKWGLGREDSTGIPNRHGFDYWFGYLHQGRAHNYYPEYVWKNEEKYPLEGNVVSDEHKRVAIERVTYSHDVFADDALDFLDNHKGDTFFLYLAFTLPHANNERGRYDGNGMEIPDYGQYTGRDWPDPKKGHAAMISRLDRDVGRIIERLRELGLDKDTVVFFTSDNGPHKEGGADPAFFNSSGPLRGYKRDLYEGGIRVPAIVRWPGKIEPGSVSRHPWASWDFMPTAADLAGVETPENTDGISIVPVLFGGKQKEHEFMYWEFHEGAFKQAVRMGKWKAVSLDPEKPLELYDLTKDTGEKNDIADQHPDIVEKIEKYLAKARTPSKRWPGKPRKHEVKT